MRRKRLLPLTTFVCAALAMSMMIGCDGSDEADTSSNTAEASTASLPTGLFLAAAPAEPVAVKQLKAQAQVGDEVTMRVVVGGEVNVFVPGRAIVKVEKLTGLGNGTKQRIVTPGTFLGLVETDCSTLCVSFGGLYRAIKIQCQSGQSFALQSIDYH